MGRSPTGAVISPKSDSLLAAFLKNRQGCSCLG